MGNYSPISQLLTRSSRALVGDSEAAPAKGRDSSVAAADDCICTVVSERCFALTRFISQWAEKLQD